MKRLESIAFRLRALAALPCLVAAVAVAVAGEVHGTITASGPLPVRPSADRKLDPACGKGEAGDDPLLVSSSGLLQNAVVRIVRADDEPAAAGASPLPPIVVRQKNCSYVPRVQAALRGQAVVIENRDSLLHNLHAFSGRKGLFNVAQPAGSPPVKRDLTGVDMLRLKCDIHPWMLGWVVFNATPYFAVTGADGRFAIRDVPAGTYELSVWHELLGTREVEIEVPPGSLRVDVDLGRR